MKSISLSEDARNLLRRRAAGEHIEVTPDNLEIYRELARAGVMYPLSAFMQGPEAVFRFTEEGWNMREVLQRPSRLFTPSAMLRRIRRAFSPISKSVSGTCRATSEGRPVNPLAEGERPIIPGGSGRSFPDNLLAAFAKRANRLKMRRGGFISN